MNKKILFTLVALLFSAVLVCTSAAAEATVYVQTGANGSGASVEDAVGSFEEAIAALDGKGGTVVLLNSVSAGRHPHVPEQTGDLTVTATGAGALVLTDAITFAKNTNDNLITLDAPIVCDADGARIFGGFNSICLTKNTVVTGTLDFYGGTYASISPSNTTTGFVEEKTAMTLAASTELPYSITVDGGTYRIFAGGNYRPSVSSVIGSIAAPVAVTVNGGTFTSAVSYTADSALKIDDAFSLSGASFLADDVTFTVNGGTFNTPVYVQGYIGETGTTASASSILTKSDAKYYAFDGDVAITLNGGTFNGCEISVAQTAATYNRVLRGNFTVTVGANVTLADGLVLDATQVKAYEGGEAKATLTAAQEVNCKRFDIVNGESKTYTEPIRIACVGDSITQGSCAYVNGVVNYEEYAYPAHLYKQAIAAGEDVIISNYGCGATKVMNYSGLWYNAGLAYVLSMEETDADYIVVGLGTNDSGVAGNSRGGAERFEEMYADFIGGYAALPNTKTVYGTSAIYRYRADASAVGVIRAKQEKVLRAMEADGKRAKYVDLYALTLDAALAGDLLYTDALHPDAAGYAIYADKIYGALFDGVCEIEGFEMNDIWVAPAKPSKNAIAGATYGTRKGSGTKDDPTDTLSIAFAKAAPNATIHIVGDYDYTKMTDVYNAFNTPYSVEKLTLVGEPMVGTAETVAPSLSVNSKYFYINSDMTLDNLELSYSDTEGGVAMYIQCGYNNVTFTNSFTTLGNANALLCLGYMAFSDTPTSGRYSSVESISSDKDCTINILGGDFAFACAGNLHWAGSSYTKAPYGTYSGNMTLNVDSDVTFKTSSAGMNGIVGMNYLAGSITANLGAWHADKAVRDYCKIGSYSDYMKTYDESANTGTVTVNLAEGLERELLVTGDFDGDHDRDLADALILLGYKFDGFDSTKSDRFYGRTEVQLVHVLRALRALTK